MQRLAVIAQLKPGAEARAKELIEQGPPFSPAETGFERHTVFASAEPGERWAYCFADDAYAEY